MRVMSIALAIGLIIIAGAAVAQPNELLLPEDFTVWSDGNVVINHPYLDFAAKPLQTVNDYTGAPGCYVACYSHQQEDSAYGVGGGIYVMGQVRVPGHYEGRVCLPEEFEEADISAESHFSDLCTAHVSACAAGGCWAGGDTGGWFGIQQ